MKKQLAQGAAVSLLLQVCLAAEEPMSKGYTIPTIDLGQANAPASDCRS